jgi:transmembrane sensor
MKDWKMTAAEPIDLEAGDWFARRQSGEWTPAEEIRYQAWLAASPLHRVAYLRIEHAWERAGRLQVLKAGSKSRDVPPPGQWHASPFFGFSAQKTAPSPDSAAPQPQSRAWRIAAAATASALLVAFWLLRPDSSAYRTPVGGLESVPMADGSTVTLNTDTALRVLYTERTRRVKLERGEAFFEVAKDLKRPFVVEVGNRRVMAVGTQFSVRRADDEVEVIVTEGTVRLTHVDALALPSTVEEDGGQTAEEFLPAGTMAQIGESGVTRKEESLTAAAEQLSWRQGVLHFRETTLAQAVSEFNRYNSRQVIIQDPAVAGYLVAGDFRATNVEAFVRLIQHGYPIKVSQQANQIVLQAR